ncbi:heterokaryon incompatibility protein-domain-containing protein [Calycina marina]|uniref:Heterokaryon incompatibility protein-domain-containing protein n=1 Tax=Calycina marina TaxID=1763456 RepID=A0A9P7ZBY5_9HELO|nr:heterokaryon incompatibility protein-domain-containing protein [Calycina marina]
MCILALSEDAQEIRIPHILPGAFEDKIRVHFDTGFFSAGYGIKFEAFSYHWGSTVNDVDLPIEAADAPGVIPITRSLSEALPYLRYDYSFKVIWIDAVCVNEQDLAERSDQVKRMADIYSSALGVNPCVVQKTLLLALDTIQIIYKSFFLTSHLAIEPDYAMSVDKVTIDFPRNNIEKIKYLGIFSTIEKTDRNSSSIS